MLAPEGYGEVIGGGERATSLEFLRTTNRRARPAQGSVRMVSGSAPLWQRAARRFRHGHRTLHSLDVRHRARARNNSVSANDVPLASLSRQKSFIRFPDAFPNAIKRLSFVGPRMEDKLRIEFHQWAKDGRGESMERGHRPTGEQAVEMMHVGHNARVIDIGWDPDGLRDCLLKKHRAEGWWALIFRTK